MECGTLLVAEVPDKATSKMIGVGRVIVDHDQTFGKVAVLVQDDFQGRGLGSKFVEMLIGIAREKGLDYLRADAY